MAWWLDNRVRMVQNNLRDIDAAMDVDALVQRLEDLESNCVMVGAGGISSFFPTELWYQTPSPYLNGRDTLGEIIEKCHAKGIRVIARFDFSKTHERLYEGNKHWYYKSEKGDIVRYNDTVATCICGEYQQLLSLEIIREVITKYPVDGIFFNMFGFITHDYSNNDYGICHCDECKRKFYEYSGLELPGKDSPSEHWDKYNSFKEYIVSDVLHRIHDLTRSVSEDIAVCTYHHAYVDMVRNESNSAVDRPLPFWLNNSACNVDMVRTSYKGTKVSSNCCINAIDIFYRFTGVSSELNKIRLYEEMAAGGCLDWCIIGVFEDYPDAENYEGVKEVFHFHKTNERYFGHFKSLSKVAIVQPEGVRMSFAPMGDSQSFSGVYKALKEEHILFDVIAASRIVEEPSLIDGYKVLIYPSGSAYDAQVIGLAQERGILNVLLNATKPLGEDVSSIIDAQISGKIGRKETRAAYWNTREKEIFKSFNKRQWVIADDDVGIVDAHSYCQYLPLVASSMFGPPERCYGHKLTDIHGALINEANGTLIIPWDIGGLFYRYGYRDHSHLLMDLLDAFSPEIRVVRTNAPEMVELFVDDTEEGDHVVQLLNLTGFNGMSVGRHIPVVDVDVVLPEHFVGEPKALTGNSISIRSEKGRRILHIDKVDLYTAVAFDNEVQ